MNKRRNHQMHADGFVVELGGFEPPTLSMPWRCATSCAIAPFSIVSPFLNLVYITTGSCIMQIGVSPNDIGVIWRHHNHRLFRSTFPFPLVGIGDGWTVVIVHEPPTNRVIRLIHVNQTHPVCIAHGYHRRKSGIDCGDAQQRLKRLCNPRTMGEHKEIGVRAGTRGPVTQGFDATLPHMFFGLGAILHLAAAMLHPGTEVLRISLSQFGYGVTVPIAKTAFAYARIIVHFGAIQYICKSLCGGMRTAQIGTHDDAFVSFWPAIDV